MKITSADSMDFTGYDPMMLLMAEGTDRLWAASLQHFVLKTEALTLRVKL